MTDSDRCEKMGAALRDAIQLSLPASLGKVHETSFLVAQPAGGNLNALLRAWNADY